MRKSFTRVVRVAQRLWSPRSQLQSWWEKFLKYLYLLGFLGVGIATWKSADFRAWAMADWTHVVFVVASVVAVDALCALWALEKEVDELGKVQVSILTAVTELRSTLKFGDGSERRGVFQVTARLSLRNDRDKPTRAFFPRLDFFGRERGVRHWSVLEVDEVHIYSHGGAILRGLTRARDKRESWYSGKRHEIPGLDELVVEIVVFVTSRFGESAFLGREIKLAVTFDVLGQPPEVKEIVLPMVEAALAV